jgi:peptide/nickel transport system permease protein
VVLGALIGITAGFFRGWIGAVLMRFTDLMMAFPALLLAIALAALFSPSIWIVAMVIAMVNWVQVACVNERIELWRDIFLGVMEDAPWAPIFNEQR